MTDANRTQIGNLASRRETCAEHNERIRKLRNFVASMMAARSGDHL